MTTSMRDETMVRRNKAVSMAMKRKEEYLGARVPKELRDRVINRAVEMGLPVSILIRNILEEAFKDNVSVAPERTSPLVGEVGTSSVGKFDTVLGWDRIVLNKSVPCTCCGVQLAAGKDVTLGLGAAQPVIICDECKSTI